MEYYHTLRKVFVTEEEYKKELDMYNRKVLKQMYIIELNEEKKKTIELENEIKSLKEEIEKLKKELDTYRTISIYGIMK